FWAACFRVAPFRATTASFRTSTFGAGTARASAARFGSATLRTSAFGRATTAFARSAFTAAIAIATFTTAAADFAHLIACFFALVVAELAVAVFIEVLDYFFAHLSATVITVVLAFLVAGIGAGRDCQQPHGEKGKAGKQIPHESPHSERLLETA